MKLKRIVLPLLAVALVFNLFACGNKGGEKVDTGRTQLWVSNYNGGIGDEWLKSIKTRFENAYKNEEFEEGRTGVQVMIENTKISGSYLDVANSFNEVFFTQFMYYYEMIEKGYALDITDTVNAVNTDNKTVLSKLDDEQKSYYSVNGKFYGIPHYAGYPGLTYNATVFETYRLYFKAGTDGKAYKNAQGSYVFIDSLSDARSAGPDGDVMSASDNGLPATYEEFFALCDYMIISGVTPFIWSGQHENPYIDLLLTALMTDYEGLEQSRLNYTFEGTAKNLVQSIDNGVATKAQATVISPSDGYNIYGSAGRYYALSFLSKILSKPSYTSNKISSSTHTHTAAQLDYVLSDAESSPVAFLVDGVWWENEAKLEGVQEHIKNYNVQYSDIKFSYMPLPKATPEDAGNPTLIDAMHSLSFINSKIAPNKIGLAKLFLQFCTTDESLQEFTVMTNTPKALKYELTDAHRTAMSNYGRSVWDISRRTDVVYPVSNKSIYIRNQADFSANNSFQTPMYNYALPAMRLGVNPENFFFGIKERMQSAWPNFI